ncbi:hypothetical protein CYMTET_23364, partial [Cymbomonas tetramitiformis]
YTVEQGAWVSPGVEKCGAAKDTVEECFLRHVYECTHHVMCHSDFGRTYNALDVAKGLTLCRNGHVSTTVLCGGCEKGYIPNVYGICSKCGDWPRTMAQVVSVMACFALSVYILWETVLRTSRAKLEAHLGKDGSARQRLTSMESTETMELMSTFITIVTGYFQVIGPTWEMFGTVSGAGWEYFATPLSLVGLPLTWMLQLQCVAYNMAGSDEFGNNFSYMYVELLFKALMPWLVLLGFGAAFIRAHLRLVNTIDMAVDGYSPEETEDAELQNCELAVRKHACIASISFLLVICYPVVGMQMFEIFHCDKILNDGTPDYDKQFWLRTDRNVQCFAHDWWFPASIAQSTILVYIVGLPLIMWRILRHLYSFKKYQVVVEKKREPATPSNTQQSEEMQNWNKSVVGCVLLRRPRRHSFPPPTMELYPTYNGQVRKDKDKRRLARVHSMDCQEAADDEPWFVYAKKKDVEDVPSRSSSNNNGKQLGRLEVDGRLETVEPVLAGPRQNEHHVTKLQDTHMAFYWGRFYLGCRPELYMYSSWQLFVRVLQTAAVVVVRIIAPRYDLLYAFTIATVSLMANLALRPYQSVRANQLERACMINLVLMLFILMELRAQQEHNARSETGYAALQVFLVVSQFLLFVYIGCTMLPIARKMHRENILELREIIYCKKRMLLQTFKSLPQQMRGSLKLRLSTMKNIEFSSQLAGARSRRAGGMETQHDRPFPSRVRSAGYTISRPNLALLSDPAEDPRDLESAHGDMQTRTSKAPGKFWQIARNSMPITTASTSTQNSPDTKKQPRQLWQLAKSNIKSPSGQAPRCYHDSPAAAFKLPELHGAGRPHVQSYPATPSSAHDGSSSTQDAADMRADTKKPPRKLWQLAKTSTKKSREPQNSISKEDFTLPETAGSPPPLEPSLHHQTYTRDYLAARYPP